MYAIGWRKSPDENQIVGNYIKKIWPSEAIFFMSFSLNLVS
jgi:hypothetical protein